MGFPTDWNGSKIRIDIDTTLLDRDRHDWTLHFTQKDSPIFTEANGMLDALGSNHLLSDGADIRFSKDQAGLEPLDFKVYKTVVNSNPKNGKLDVAVLMFATCNIPISIYMWWGNIQAIQNNTKEDLRPFSDTKLGLTFNTI